MTEIFRIWPDLDYTQFAPTNLSPLDIGHFCAGLDEAFGQPVPKINPPVAIKAARARDRTLGGFVPSDCPNFTAQCLLLSARAREVLDRVLLEAGCFLETKQEDIKIDFYIYKCRHEVDCIDQDKSSGTRMSDGSLFGIDTYVFLPQAIERNDVFRLPRRGDIFVSERFVELANSANLTGFVFQRVWSSETGPVEHPGYPHRGPAAVWRQQITAKTAARRAYLQSVGYPMEELTGKLDLR